jgi:hypothetical protein
MQELLRVLFCDPDITGITFAFNTSVGQFGHQGITMQLSPACLGGKVGVPVDQREPTLPHDALRSVFSYLDW